LLFGMAAAAVGCRRRRRRHARLLLLLWGVLARADGDAAAERRR